MHQPSLELLNKKHIILADATPERQALLKDVGLRVTLCNTTAKENLKPDDFWLMSDYLENSALQKVNEIEQLFQTYGISPDIIIASDTSVKIDNIMYNKPKEDENIFKILKMVSGKYYIVTAGVVIKMDDKLVKFTETTKVFVRNLTDNDIRAYVATEEPFNKTAFCGLYGIGNSIVDNIEGDYFTVIGLPLLRLGKELENLVS